MFELNMDMITVKWMSLIISTLYLIILSIQDIYRQTISVRLLAAGTVAAVLYQIFRSDQTVSVCLVGVLIGILFIGISKITKEALGYGDSLLILILGIYLGGWNLMYLLMITFSVSAVFSMGMLIKHHCHKKKTFPFIPFLTAGYFILNILVYVES